MATKGKERKSVTKSVKFKQRNDSEDDEADEINIKMDTNHQNILKFSGNDDVDEQNTQYAYIKKNTN